MPEQQDRLHPSDRWQRSPIRDTRARWSNSLLQADLPWSPPRSQGGAGPRALLALRPARLATAPTSVAISTGRPRWRRKACRQLALLLSPCREGRDREREGARAHRADQVV